MTILLAAAGFSAFAQEDPPALGHSPQEKPVRAERELYHKPLQERTSDLWYGIPGVRPGGDLIGPIRDLVRDPSGLKDLRPRKVQSYLPDRETAEFLRDPRW
jgi:hypothetical protein